MKVFYFGELGFFSTGIIPYLDIIMNTFLDIKLDIITLPDYAELLKTIYIDRITIIDTIYTISRDYHHITNNQCISNLLLEYPDYQPLYTFIENTIVEYNLAKFGQAPYKFMNICPTKTLMVLTNSSPVTQSILFFPRIRKDHPQKFRNFPPDLVDSVINTIAPYNIPYYIVGHQNEILETKYQSINGLLKLIPYFNSAKLFITCDSGLVDFAKLCGCKNILIVYSKNFFDNVIMHHNYISDDAKLYFVEWGNPIKMCQKISYCLSDYSIF